MAGTGARGQGGSGCWRWSGGCGRREAMVQSSTTAGRSQSTRRMATPTAHYNLGVLLENKADYGGAEQHYRRARAIDPEEHADAHCELAGQARPSWCL